jgi:hypothetical protein
MFLSLGDSRRSSARPIANLEKMQLAPQAAQDNPTGSPHPRPVGFSLGQWQRPDFLDGLEIIEAMPPWVQAQGLNAMQLLGPAGLKLILGICHG